ncbi:MAG: hypothetical protein WAT09_09860 [Paracoccaceae bacterium]
MKDTDIAWQAEIDRRARIYDGIEAQGTWQGRMTTTDYLGLAVLVVGLVVGFWIWGAS